MNFFSYVVARDYGFAPNPFGGICTLATCKQDIRKAANVGDWVLGCGSVSLGQRGFLLYAMQVTEITTFDDYYEDPRFQYKKPVLNGSLKQTYGDNIYRTAPSGEWEQLDSHHSNSDGSINEHNLARDTKSDRVLISKNYYYFGKAAISIPSELQCCIWEGRNFKYVDEDKGLALINFLEKNYDQGMINPPTQFHNFSRYNGIS